VVLLLGLVLVTSAERLTGAPMLAVLCGGLVVGRLGGEVAQGRWRALTDEERQALRSVERWSRSLNQLAEVVASLIQSSLELLSGVSAWLAKRRQGRSHGKRWVRAEIAPTPPVKGPTSDAGTTDVSAPPTAEATGLADAVVVGEVAPPEGPETPAQLSLISASPGSSGGGDAATAPSGEVPLAVVGAPQSDPVMAAPAPGTLPATGAPGGAVVPPADRRDQAPPAGSSGDPGVRVVADFAEVDALLAAASLPQDSGDAVASVPDPTGAEHPEQPAPDGSAGSSAELS